MARRRIPERLLPRDVRLESDVRGAVFVEYMVLVGFVAIVMALMLASLGPEVVREYSARRGTLYAHSP